MALNKAVVQGIHRYLENPDTKILHKMVVTGSIFRYLEYQDQLGQDVCDKLVDHLTIHLKTLDNKILIKLYEVLGKGLISSKSFGALLSNSIGKSFLKPKPSMRSSYYG
jgi:hypothetical protein